MECAIADSSGQPKHGSYIIVMLASGGISVVVPYTNKVVFVRKGGTMLRDSVDHGRQRHRDQARRHHEARL